MISGLELDSSIARRVWGYVVIINTQTGEHNIMGKDRVEKPILPYSSELDYAYKVVERMQERGFSLQVKSILEDNGSTTWVTVFNRSDVFEHEPSQACELPLAICMAALTALGY